MLPNGINLEGYSWLGEDLRFNTDGSLIFTQGRKEGKCIVWDAKTRNKLKEFKSLKSVMFQKNNFIGIINPHKEIDTLLEIIVYKTNDLSNVQYHKISLEEIGMMKVNDFEEIFISNKIVLRDSFNFKIINLISGEKEIIRTNISADEKVHLFKISNDLFFCGKNEVHCFNEISKEVKDLYALKEDDKNKELRGFVVDSINSRLFFEEISSDKEGNRLSIELKVINFKNRNILSKRLNFPVDYAFDIGSNDRGIYYETSYFSKEKSSIENGGMDEYFANNKDNHKVIYWDVEKNEILTLLDTTGGNQSADYHYINKSLYRISDNLIEIINFDKTVVKIDLDSNTIIKTSSRADNHNMIVLYSRKGIISKGITSKLENNAKDSTNLIIFCEKGIKLFTLKELSSFSMVINNDSTVVVENYNNGDIYPKWNILNINSSAYIDNFNFFGTSFNSSNSNWGYKISEDQNSLKSIDGFFDELPLNSKGFNRKKASFSKEYNLLNTFDEITNFKREIVYDSLLILRDSHDTVIYESTINNNFKGVKISKSKRFLIFEDSIKDLKTRATIYLKNALPCRQKILNYGEIASNVLEDTVNNLFYIMEQVPRKKRKQKYIYFNLKELSVNKIIHSFRIKNTYFETETAKDWRENLTLGQDFNIDFKNKRIFLNEDYKNDFLNCYDFNSPDPIWSITGFNFFKLDNNGNILAKKELGIKNSVFYKVNAHNGEILFKREFNEINDFATFLDDPKNNQILIYQNLGSIIYLNRITGEINSNYKIEGIARNKSETAKFLLSNDLLITDGLDESTQIRRASDGKLLFSFYDIPLINANKESQEPLVNNRLFVDPNYRFDGTPGAIEKLYFVCGLEVVELSQIKDSLYVPNLVQRIMNGENLDHLPKLSELNICGVTPVVEPLENDKSGNQGYRIIPRSGGVGDVDVYINGVVRLSTNAKKLKRKDGNYMLYVEKELLELYQIPGEELKVKVIAKTANNSVSSRGVVIDIESDEKITFKKPALHAIMIGVDDYKGDGLDLNYAAKDANDLQIVLQKSAQKFFNIDDTSRVHFYNLTVNRLGANGNEKIKGITPDRGNIINTIAEIEKTSKPEDILLLFFAGHGEIVDKDQLLLLTSESSRDDFKGLRMRELLELLNKVPAGKRVLILDACHSGAAINNMDMAQLTGKRDVKDAERQSQRLKELDKLASKSGFAIITASSSDQKALELPQYEHGLMTYALLNSMLNNKNALDEDNKLQLEKWLMATEEEVRKLNSNQSAERMVPINFTLGKVDDEVRSSIVLKEIPTVFVSNVLNVDLGFDDQKIKSQMITYFSEKSRGTEKTLFVSEIEQPNSVQVNVVYSISMNQITLKATLLKNNELIKRIEKTGTISNQTTLLNELMVMIEKELE
jgi:uncharacterized caspase-like protein